MADLRCYIATITHLRARKQHYKLRMFQKLYYILLAAVLVIAAFFVVSSFSFSGRLAEGFFCQIHLFLDEVTNSVFHRLCS